MRYLALLFVAAAEVFWNGGALVACIAVAWCVVTAHTVRVWNGTA